MAGGTLPFCVSLFAPDLEKDSIFLNRTFWLLLVWALLAMPLSMLKSVHVLGYTSAIAVLCVMYTTVVTVMYGVGVLDPCAKQLPEGQTCVGDIVAFANNPSGILAVLPVLVRTG